MLEKSEILKIAKLARLSLSEKELEETQEKLEALVKHFDDLSKIDTTGVEALFHFQEKLPFREDSLSPSLSLESLKKIAPDFHENCFRLPRVIGDSDS